MNWLGETHIGETWLLYRGSASDNSPHSHATLQITIGLDEFIAISDSEGKVVRGKAIAVKPNVEHKLLPSSRLVLGLIEPQSKISRLISSNMNNQSIGVINPELTKQIDWKSPLSSLFESLEATYLDSSSTLDPRLTNALEFLRNAPLKGAIALAAKHSGISEPRLRTIAKAQLGTPLSKWVSWNAIRRSTISLSLGATLSEAAIDGGFSDQAHYSRTMKKIMGLTPQQALKSSR